MVEQLQHQIDLLVNESSKDQENKNQNSEFHYPSSLLSAGEMEVIALVRKGNTNNQIAEQLYIAERTVKFHVAAIMSKLYVKTLKEAADVALIRGLLS